jgi:myo-inositol-1(or 4)-monophosphatase
MLAMKPWDVAVAGLLVTEAGGQVSRLDGSPYSIIGPDVLFSNGLLHQDLLAIL